MRDSWFNGQTAMENTQAWTLSEQRTIEKTHSRYYDDAHVRILFFIV